MNRFAPLSSFVTVFSLFLVFAIWLTPASANTPPTFTSLGQLRATGMGAPCAMDMDNDGNLYVADALGRKIYCFDQYGNLKRVYGDAAFKFADNQGLTSGRGLAVSPDGKRLYFARNAEALILDTATGTVIGQLTGSGDAPEFKLTGEIDLDANGNVVVADAGAGRLKIKIYAADGRFLKQFGGVGNVVGTFQSITSLTVNGAGQIVVADASPASLSGKIQAFTVDPVNFNVTSQTGYLKNTAANFGSVEMHTPRGIVFDDLGRGYFLEYMFSTITVVNSSFQYLSKFNAPVNGQYLLTGYNQGQIAFVSDIIYDKLNKRVFVSCDGGRVEVFGIDGGTNPVRRNTPPTAPVAQDPVGGSVVTSSAPVLSFAAATDDKDISLLKYQVVVKQGATVKFTSDWISATAITLPEGLLEENGTFAWTVQAVDAEGEYSEVGAPAAFVVNAVSEAPSAPVLQTELAEGALANERQFIWSASTDPDPNDAVAHYLVELATDAGFATIFDTMEVEGTAVALGDFAKYASLEVGAGYFCRVSAVDLAGNASASEPVAFVYDTAVLTVDAGIKGAAVYLGGNLAYPGRPVGVTPLELRDLASGRYVVAVEAVGFELSLTQLDVAELVKTSVYAQLKPALQPTAFKGAKAINGKPGLKLGADAVPFVIDYDGDGKLDLLAGEAGGSVSLFRSIQVSGNGEMTVGQAEVIPGLAGQVLPGAVPFVADWNNDNQSDLLVGLSDGTVKLFINGGADSLLQAGDVPLAVGASAAPAVVDLDGDGLKDLVVGNAHGDVFVCYNTGTDAAPELAAPMQLLAVGAPVVPAAIDWNADGNRELLVASAKGVALYSNESGAFVAVPLLATPAKAVFAVDADGAKGEDLLLGAEDGRLLFAVASSASYPPSYPQALTAKVDEIEALMVEAEAATSELLAIVATIRGQILVGSYAGAAVQAQNLATALATPEIKAAALELVTLCGDDVTTAPSTSTPTDPKPVKQAK